MRRMPPPPFRTWEEFVAFRVFKQTRTEGDVTTYEVVDRFTNKQDRGSYIVAVFDGEDEANALRDSLRDSRLAEVTR